jgi:uncharacterized membrane protein YuzA (DUF378 family)
MKATHCVGFILVIIGGLNWGILGLGEILGKGMSWNVVNMIVGRWPVLEGIVYLLVGISAIILLCTHKKDCKTCVAAPMSGQQM